MSKNIITAGGNANKKSNAILPEGFQQIEYVGNSNSASICINTGVTPNPNIGTLLELSLPDTAGGEQIFFGSSAGSPYASGLVYTFERSSNTFRYYGAGVTDSTAIVPNQKYKLKFNIDVDKKFYVDNRLIGTASSIITSSYPLGIFHRIIGQSPDTGYHTAQKVYHCVIYNNKIAVRDLYPCYCTKPTIAYRGTVQTVASINQLGMYDIVENKFYISTGSGVLSGGLPYEQKL